MLVNGNEVKLKKEISLKDFLAADKYPAERIVVELNGKIIKRQKYAETFLQDNDKIEIVCFVGGG